MTEAQRDYLADLAGRKGVRLFDTENWSVAETSRKIEELKAMPDAKFAEITDEQIKIIDKMTRNALVELQKWGFDERN